jgi:ubiquinone/menaquinone biosynthesis C-methylase UbiE
LQGSTSAIPLPDDSVDVVVSFETIEHHAEHEHMMREIKRVLKPAGQLIISSPDKKYYSDEANYQNPYHIKELYIEDFKNLIKNFFTHYDFYSQKSAQGSLIISENDKNSFTEYSGTFEGVNEIRDYKPVYHICLASDKDIPKLENSFFLDELIQLGTVWREGIDLVKQSLSYRLGNFLLSPFSLLKRLWSR